jgi:hypothetical protein
MFATAVEPFRGVQCRHCGKPVRVPKRVLNHETTALVSQPEHSLESKSFALRCRACEKESVYTMDEIVDCPVD